MAHVDAYRMLLLSSPVSRGHVLSVVFGMGGEMCFSGSADSTIRVWQLPTEPGEDPFDLYGKWFAVVKVFVGCLPMDAWSGLGIIV